MILVGGAYVGRNDALEAVDWYVGPASSPRRFVRTHACLAWVMGAGSVVDVTLVDVDGQPGEACDLFEVSQQLDLAEVTASAPLTFRLKAAAGGRGRGWQGVVGFYPFGEYRFTLIRYGLIRLGSSLRLADIMTLDCRELWDARGLPIAPASLMLLNVRGHGTYGSIQLVSRSLGERLLGSYPDIYSA